MKLTPEERSSPLWLKLKADFEDRRQKLRVANDSYIDAEKTTQHRAKIHLLNDLLAMETVPASIPTQPADDA